MGKVILVLCVLVLVALGIGLVGAEGFEFQEKDLDSEESMWDLYERWRSHHTTSHDLQEKRARFNVFKENVKHIHTVNQMKKPYKLKLNKFADMTNYEFVHSGYANSKVSHFRSLRGSRRATPFSHDQTDNLPSNVDWRRNGAVTGIKDPGRCGSCWAFSAVVAIEGIDKIKSNQLVSLSEQELVDCDRENAGCDGGLMEQDFDFIHKTGGITTELSYPYKAIDETCDSSKITNAPRVVIDGYEHAENDEIALMKAVVNQPVSVAIDAGGKDLQFYSEGVFNGTCGTELNHGVAVVGYGAAQDGTKYWIVKNSWGTEWGEKCHLRMKRGVQPKQGLCGIAKEASYPMKSSPNPTNTKTASSRDEL